MLILVATLTSAGCAHYPTNDALSHFDAHAGYRFGNLQRPADADELFIVLCFSGGGTRAAAFSYGVLQELRNTANPAHPERSLLDDVDVIASVSGGSFTAAYYALFGDRIFSDFQSKFLTRDVQGELVRCALNPVNWWRLASPWYSRIDLAAEYYDREIFNGKTFGDLATRGKRPYLVINATDMSLGSQFEFTQEQFDQIYSDLSTFKVARAVAASSAFPVLLCPLTLDNHQPGADFIQPEFLNGAKNDIDASPRRYLRATEVQSYYNASLKPHIHLLDGGIADNVALRGVWQSVEYRDILAPADHDDSQRRALSIWRMVKSGAIKKLIVISVNARPGDSTERDKSACTPGLIDVILNIATMPMANYSFETVELMRRTIDERNKMAKDDHLQRPMYAVRVDFEHVTSPAIRNRLKGLGTNYHLKKDDVDLLESEAAKVLRNSQDFKNLLADLAKPSWNKSRVPASRPSTAATGH